MTEKKKLILIMPPQQGLLKGFAAGLISLANFVNSRIPELSVNILDFSDYSVLNAESALSRVLRQSESQPTFVGITTTTASYQSALAMARQVKRMSPDFIVVMGGHHVSADPETVLANHKDIIDFIVVGEGERSLFQLLQDYPTVSGVPGICHLDTDGRFLRNAPPVPLSQAELDSISVTFEDVGLVGTPGKFGHTTYVSARGCPLNCSFCAVGSKPIRCKSTSAVVRDLELLLDSGFCRFAFEDNFFAHSPSRTQEICEALAIMQDRSEGGFSWDCQTRLESLASKETITLLETAGCEAVYIGVESLDAEQLTYLNKTKDPSKYLTTLVEGVVPSLLKTDIKCYLNLQFGLPIETPSYEQVTRTILERLGRMARASGKTIMIFPQLHVIYPGTAHFNEGVSQGRFPRDIFETFTKWEYTQPPIVYWLGEHFAHGAGGIPEGILKPDGLCRGRFDSVEQVIDLNAVFRISGFLRAISRIPGIDIFNYGDFLMSGTGSDDRFPTFKYEAEEHLMK